MPSLNGPTVELPERARIAKDAGAGGLLILPGLSSLDTMRAVADDDAIGLPIMGHPAFLGAYVLSETHGIEHGLMFGTLYRLAGADMTVYPNYGGRFSFSQDACRSIADACRAPLGDLAPIFATPGGGMTMPRLAELTSFYGPDTALLIGGDLQRGDLLENVRRMRTALDAPGGDAPGGDAPGADTPVRDAPA
jgi:ribulose-bisphosphate carboxylase large chain